MKPKVSNRTPLLKKDPNFVSAYLLTPIYLAPVTFDFIETCNGLLPNRQLHTWTLLFDNDSTTKKKKTFTLKCAFERSSLLTKSKLLLPNYKSRHFLLSKLIVTTFPPPHKQSWCNQRGCDISLIYRWTGSDFIFLIYSGPQTWFSEPQFSKILNSMNEIQLPFSYFTLHPDLI